MLPIPRRKALSIVALGLFAPQLVLAQKPLGPGSTVRIVTPFPPGSSYDGFARKLAEKLGAKLGCTVIVDPKLGAGTTLAAIEVKRNLPDGQTLLLTSADALVSSPLTIKVPYNPKEDFTPIGKLLDSPVVLMLGSQYNARNLQQFVELAKAAKDPVAYGTFGPGTMPHLVLEAFSRKADIKLLPVAYRGTSQALQDVLGGQIALAIVTPGQASMGEATGKARAIAVVGTRRAPSLPNVPTFAESGFDSYFTSRNAWASLFGPAKMDPALVSQIFNAATRAMQEADLQQWMREQDLVAANVPAAKFKTDLDTEIQTVSRFILEDLKLQPQDLAGPR
jgi:tripartite-type tricarboxylate transporter receptor subunit TctC